MQPLLRTKRKMFIDFKRNVAKKVGGRIELKKEFPKAEDRKNLYNALLFEMNINGGNENKEIVAVFNCVVLRTLFT
ncbi:MAG: hypothetical protein Q8K30_07155 [Candidatus Gracilibacteria bacterium]|nr:hypothetical protein [Candidatus Gracilibacteria bacterium]MDP2396553.1 hypothetical protein [bacterium]MDP3381147.1 hypothetical protein [bacterium]